MKYSLPVFGRGLTEFIDYDDVNDICIRNDNYVRQGVLHVYRKMQRPDGTCYWIIGDFSNGEIDPLCLKTAPERDPVPRAPEIEDDEYFENLYDAFADRQLCESLKNMRDSDRRALNWLSWWCTGSRPHDMWGIVKDEEIIL